METLVSAALADLVGRAISFTVDRCCHRRRKAGTEDAPQRLHRALLRVQAVVEEADRRCVTNQAMIWQLQLMREGVYRGYYLLSASKRRQGREVSGGGNDQPPSFAVSQFNPAKRLCTLSARACRTNTTASEHARREEKAEAELQEVLGGLERMAGDMKELVVLLSCYPPTRREPYGGHLWLANRMFGREAEQERLVSFLLEPEPARAEHLGVGVLPVIGRARIGKSTLVEHVCLDERVRKHFSLILFLGEGDIKDGDPHPGDDDNNGTTKHEDLGSAAGTTSLVVVELAGDVDEHTWWGRTLPALRRRRAGAPPVSKIIVTSRSAKIACLGTTRPLELKPLPREAYWYFFKTIAFGSSADAEDQPELGSMSTEMADLLHGSFIGANMFAVLLRANPCPRFWRKVLDSLRRNISMHMLLFGEHPSGLLASGRPAYLWRLPKADGVLVAYSCDQKCPAQQHELPKITLREVQTGSATPRRGNFQVLAWRSNIPPYYSYVLNCGVQAAASLLRVPPRNKGIRHRQARARLVDSMFL